MRNILIALLFILAIPVSVSAISRTVSPGGSSIQSVINVSSDGDTIILLDGTYSGPGNRDIDLMGKAITVRSQSLDPSVCIIDCEGSPSYPRRGFYIHNEEGNSTVIQAITIRNGYVDGEFMYGSGGAIYIYNSEPLIIGCWFEDNTATGTNGGLGGAVYVGNTYKGEMTGCRFTGNSAN